MEELQARHDYPVAVLCSALGGLAQWVLRLVRAAGLGPSARRRAAEGGHPRGACGQSPDLWHAPGAGGAAGAGLRGRARPGGSITPHDGAALPAKALLSRHRGLRAHAARGRQPPAAALRRQRARPSLAHRSHLYPHRRGLALSGRAQGHVYPRDRRLRDGRAHDSATLLARARPRPCPAQTPARADPPLRPGAASIALATTVTRSMHWACGRRCHVAATATTTPRWRASGAV